MSGDKDETVAQHGAQLSSFPVKFVSFKTGHHHVTNDNVVFLLPDFVQRFNAVVCNIDHEILVGLTPLKGIGELSVVIHKQDGFELA